MPNATDLTSRFAGCLLGQALGDALGAPFEGMPAAAIYGQFGRAANIVASPPVDELYYTDDTQQTIVVAEHLCTHGQIKDDELVQAFAQAYDPKRGYGTGARVLLEAVNRGEDWRPLTTSIFPGGSYGNGGAMRAAPVGLLFHHDLDKVWEQAGQSAAITHKHPLGIEGAQLLAAAVALAVRGQADHDTLFYELYKRATQEEFQWLLRTAAKLSSKDSLGYLGSSLEAHRSVVTSIACFAVSPNSYPTTLARALALGDDTDTVMAMAGAISGAHLGLDAIPENLLALLENEAKGRDHIQALSHDLLAKHLSQTP